MNSIYVLVFLIVFLIIYYILAIFNNKYKSFKFFNKFNSNLTLKFENSIKELLFDLDYPYKLTHKKYFFIKYILSIIIFIISLINYKSLIIPMILGATIYFFPNILLNNFLKSQNIKLIKEIKKINNSLILKLSAHVPQAEAIKTMIETIQDKRIKKYFSKFAYDYEVLGFNFKRAADRLLPKFKSPELEIFLQILIQSESNGSIIENLERFSNTLELSYSKYLRSIANKRLVLVVMGTVIMLINIILVSMYPIIVQVINNLQMVFL